MRLHLQGAAMTALPGPVLIGPVGFGPSHGHLYIYSAPRAVLQHIQWSVAEVLKTPVTLNWQQQPIAPSTFRCEISWQGIVGTGAQLTSTLKGWHYLTFELHEAAANGSDGSIFMFTPDLGLFHGTVGPHGDLMINENQIRKALGINGRDSAVIEEIERLLGTKWDEHLEPFRQARDGFGLATAKVSV
ncbi:MAG: hypothetical protein RLY29_278 [Actinomycetota bacterium]